MIKLIKNTICFFILLVFLTNCGSVFNKSKKPDGAEFLVKKKNPLIMPSDFNVLPSPKNLNNDNKNKNQGEDTFDIKKALGDKSKTKTSSSKKTNSSLEKSIIEKINKE
jgi:hypothetical protein|tara:strand:- start:297 stop:623 length:327 start_codon:yes stop_codon:yes gene_type:complete